ncbi:hypothetical protein C8A01DRAFT_33905 [Parachaetomium inaequale]|uniref:Amidase domain-containing protein n=1 Tax=Parachaetomium inaequale TaxID=2588326 RepID=A0AAN6SSZ1_9PEZI|nr:hypothetical protein C8A01DRAFT_33905 [Parachaetomium inaequale]
MARMQTDGSICIPAGKASIVGLKATAGLISRDGTIPNSYRLDTLGILARNVKDAATFTTKARTRCIWCRKPTSSKW